MKDRTADSRRTARRPFRTVLSVIAVLFAVCVLAGVGFVAVQIARAPDISEIDARPEGYLTVILDADGNKMDTLHRTESNRIFVPLSDTPEYLRNAFIAIEDARFRSHHGIDPRGIARAFSHGLKKGGFSEGASTITQQLIKNNVLTGWTEEKSFADRLSRKIQEQWLAVRLESRCSKDWILENYLNTINLGGGTRGVQVAAQYYFGKDAGELTVSESALLAGITKNPSGYNPLKHPEASLARRDLVLDAMLREGYLTQAEHDAAQAEDVLAALVTEHTGGEHVLDWFEDELLESIVADLGEQYRMSEADAWNLLYSGGLTVCATEDPALQRICEDAVLHGGYLKNGEQVSVVLTDVRTGAVRAIVGGSEEKTASLIYNRAADAERQPGSTIKIIGEYAAALDLGQLTLGSVLCDEPYSYSDGTPLRNAGGTFRGNITVEEAIAASSNIVALKAYREAGRAAVEDYVKRFGITTLDESDFANEALAIGGTRHGVTNLELTAAYNAIAAGGHYVKPYYYTRVLAPDGKAILSHAERGTAPVKPSTAGLLTLAMESVMREGTGTAAAVSGVETAGKSGTTNDSRDLWFVGYSPFYTCGVWGGYDDNSPQGSGTYVKLLWQDIMRKANETVSGARAARLVDTAGYVQRTICTKCGLLAVGGLCDDTLQGDTARDVLYIPGTAPTESCTCHVRLSVCSESGRQAGTWCPSSCRESGVYLHEAVPGTADEGYGAEGIEGTVCDVHSNVIDHFFGSGTEKEPGGAGESGEGHDSFWDFIDEWFR